MTIQDVVCHVPPPGFVFDYLEKKMVEVGIYSRSDKKEEQYWEIPPEPVDYKKKRATERRKQKVNPSYNDPELTEYSNTEWFRRINGFWFMNNGVATYITGVHYFYLSHWLLNTGTPEFRYGDLQYFYFWASCVEDPNCLGMCNYANRQNGKSFRAGIILFDIVSRTKSVRGGIQSKAKDDAAEFFTKCVTNPIIKLKDFFIPIYDKQLGLGAKSRLRFYKKSKSEEDESEEDSIDALNSEIDYREAGPKAYDGSTLKICVQDEFGKLDPEHSLLERHRTVKPAIISGKGKFLYCTTVEDMASGNNIRESKELWDMSDPKKRLDNGKTPSGLYRFWLPSYETMAGMFDKFGMPKIEEARAELLSARNYYLSTGDYVAYASECRKYPMTVTDIFRVAAKAPVWDIIRISDQLAVLQTVEEEELRVKGNFVWKSGDKDSQVKFIRTKAGRFSIHPKVLAMLENEEQDLQRPKNRHRFVAGCDPFEQAFAETPSDGAAYVYAKFDPAHPEISDWIVLEYCGRPQPSVFFEDMLKMVIFFGMELNVENNKVGLINHITGRGYKKFLYNWTAKTPGTYSSTQSKELAAEHVSEYVKDFCQNIPFPALLEDMAMFDLSDSTEYDRSMAMMWTVLAAGNRYATKKQEEEKKGRRGVVPRHKIRR